MRVWARVHYVWVRVGVRVWGAGDGGQGGDEPPFAEGAVCNPKLCRNPLAKLGAVGASIWRTLDAAAQPFEMRDIVVARGPGHCRCEVIVRRAD